jgi:myo-inositol-1(or 4)-monophosphatase
MGLERELAAARYAALAAGAAIMSLYRSDFVVRTKADDSPVTEADHAADRLLHHHLMGEFPDDGWLSEETADTDARLARERVWIVDPLDGTREFAQGVPEFGVSIGLAVGGRAVLGVLFNPASGELYEGAVDHPATLNGNEIRASAVESIGGARILCSPTDHGRGVYDRITEVKLIPMGSLVNKLGSVASGRAEATFATTSRGEWDVCGGAAILTAAGGRITDRHGEPYRFNQERPRVDGLIASNGRLHREIARLMA